MDYRQERRLQYYCNRIGISRIIRQDIWNYVEAAIDEPSGVDYMKYRNTLMQLDILPMGEALVRYMKMEEQLFNKYIIQVDYNESAAWSIVHDEIEKDLSKEIAMAKEAAKVHNMNRGCMFLTIIIVVGIIALILVT